MELLACGRKRGATMVSNNKKLVEGVAVKAETITVKDRDAKLQEAVGAKPVDAAWANGKGLGLTDNCVRVLMSRYLKKGPDGKCTETPEDLFRRVAFTIAAAEARYGAA